MESTTCSTSWIDALVDCAAEFCQTTFGFDGIERLETTDSWSDDASGSFVALVGESTSVQLAITASCDVCKKLANLFLGLEPDCDDLSNEEIVDVMGELTNIVAGMCKTRMAESGQLMSLSIPLFVEGRLPHSENQELRLAKCLFGNLPVQLIVLEPRVKGANNDHGTCNHPRGH